MEKEDLNKPKESRGKTATVLLTVGLVGVTVALVLLAAIGGVYVTQLQSNCTTAQRTKPDYQEKYQTKNLANEDQEVDVDPKHHLQKVTTKDDTGKTTSTVVFNYHARIVTIHFPEDDQCYLVGGMDNEIEEFAKGFLNTKGKQVIKNDNHNITYDVVDEKPVHDTSLVAEELRNECAKGNMYWLTRSQNVDQTTTTRRKRAFCRHCHRVSNCCRCWYSCHWHYCVVFGHG